MTSSPWKWCPEQKKKNPKCICINIIHKDGDATAKSAGATAFNKTPNKVASVIGSSTNVSQCCPEVSVTVKYKAISGTDWTNKIISEIGADGKISSSAEAKKFWNDDITVGHRDNCINIYMIPYKTSSSFTSEGETRIGPPGNGSLDPGTANSVANVGAHEIGHSLGLDDDTSAPTSNLMHLPQPHGQNLTSSQCKTIWKNIDNYPCP